jgi:hypothetical protein
MISNNVQNRPSSRVSLHQQFFKKVDKRSPVLGFRRRPDEAIFLPVVTAKNVSLLFFCWSVAGIHLCCPIFVHHTRCGGSSVTVISSTKMSLKSSPRTFFSTLPTDLRPQPWHLYPANGPDPAFNHGIYILFA